MHVLEPADLWERDIHPAFRHRPRASRVVWLGIALVRGPYAVTRNPMDLGGNGELRAYSLRRGENSPSFPRRVRRLSAPRSPLDL